ncbi:transcription termination factor MTERF2, chloroplastic-like [Sesamum indicum]|uniref:Transcription termination factor MTERF2, chloroplastic-like n=1 Tax=Sesamum indicum TaxID=4182 RepID=A0A6I9UIG7_SESIN|nr:transcription termination factor MTERF2, chloroplastic-like [Sesamum indicum]
MSALVRKNLTCLVWKNIAYGRKSHVSSSHSLLYFCTSTDGQPLSDVSVSDFLLHKHNFSPEVVSKVASVLARLKNPEESNSILSYLKESGFSHTQLEKIVKYRPRFLLARLDDSIKPKIKIFQDLGLSSDEIAKAISSNPAILHLSAKNNIIPSLSVLKRLVGSNREVAKLLKLSAWFVTSDLEKTMVPNVEFLKSCGVPMERINMLIYNYPRCLLLHPEIIRQSVSKAEKLGMDRKSKMFIYAVRIIASMSQETWEFKMQAFRDLGFSESDILAMFKKAPSLFSGSMEKIRNVKEVLLATGKISMSCIVKNPMSLACSIEKRYKPRLRILEMLESRNLIENWPSLGTIYTYTDDKFFNKYIPKLAKDTAQNVLLGERETCGLKHLLKELE